MFNNLEYKSKLMKIHKISSNLLNNKNGQISDLNTISEIATSIIDSENTKKLKLELKNRFNHEMELWKILDLIDEIKIENNEISFHVYWKVYIKIKKYCFYQEFYGDDSGEGSKYLYFSEGDHKYCFEYTDGNNDMEIDDELKKNTLQFINEFLNYFQIENQLDPIDFLFFILILVSHDFYPNNNNINIDYEHYGFDEIIESHDYDISKCLKI